MDRELATKLLIYSAFPMLTPEIQDAYAVSHARWKGPPGNHKVALDLLRDFYAHFEDMNFFMLGNTFITIPSKGISGKNGAKDAPNDKSIFDDISQAHIETMITMLQSFVTARIELDKLPNADFIKKSEPVRLKILELIKTEAKEYDSRQFYSFPEAQANWKYWLRQPCWSLEEATALCFGKDPDVVNIETLKPLQDAGQSAFVQDYFMLRRQIYKANAASLLKDPSDPKQFIEWARKSDVNFQVSNVDAQQESGVSLVVLKDHQEPLPAEEVRTQAVHSLYRVVLGIIIAKYGSVADPHDIGRQKEKYEDIFNDISRVGVSMDRDTLTKYLDRAYTYARGKHIFDAPSGKPARLRKT